MPTQEIINEIAQYILDFKTGAKEHKQDEWHCGTAHCLAGWKHFDDARKVLEEIDYNESGWGIVGYPNKGINNTEDYAANVWGLDPGEADVLFDGDNTLADIAEKLIEISDEYHLTAPDFVHEIAREVV
jgi:hypothetical protein